jgi:hypothetical protein
LDACPSRLLKETAKLGHFLHASRPGLRPLDRQHGCCRSSRSDGVDRLGPCPRRTAQVGAGVGGIVAEFRVKPLTSEVEPRLLPG